MSEAPQFTIGIFVGKEESKRGNKLEGLDGLVAEIEKRRIEKKRRCQ